MVRAAAGLSTPRTNGVSNLGAPTVPAGFPIEVSAHRSDEVVVPNLQASLGLSYNAGRLKVSTGYRYETYFDAIAGGIDEARSEDRTIHGPYLRFTYGFGR